MFQFRPGFLFSIAIYCLQVASAPAYGANSVVTKAISAKSVSKAALDSKVKKMKVLKLRTSSVGLIICYASKDKFLAETSIGSVLSLPTVKDGCIIYNDMKKAYVELSLAEVKNRINYVSKQNSISKSIRHKMGWQFLPPKCLGSEVLKGIHTKVYAQEDIFPMSYTSEHILSTTSYLDESEFNQLPEGASMAISKIARARSMDRRIPLRETVHEFKLKKDGTMLKDAGTRIELDVVSLKEEPYDATKFLLPKGYTRGTNEMAVLGVDTLDGRRGY